MQVEYSEQSTRRDLLRALREKMIPWARASADTIALIEPPFIQTQNVSILHYRAPLLEGAAHGDDRQINPTRWDEHGLHSNRFPFMGCVVEGEADLETATTAAMKAQGRWIDPAAHLIGELKETPPAQLKLPTGDYQNDGWNRHVLRVPQKSFFAIPPTVPHSDGSELHWIRPYPEMAHSQIFWFYVRPSGALCHLCSTENLCHAMYPQVFIWDVRLVTLAEMLIEELRSQGGHFRTLAQSYLLALLLRMERGLEAGNLSFSINIADTLRSDRPARQMGEMAGAAIVQRATDYIQRNISENLSPEIIAGSCFVSVSHLNRLFRAELQMPIMQFVVQSRMEIAKSLLQGSDLSIHQIAKLVGYENASHFSQAFTRFTHLSPREFRKTALYSRAL